MRVADSTSYRNLVDNLNMLNERLEKASQEVSTGKRLTRPQDSPSESAEVVQLAVQLGQIDQYRTNIDNSGFFLHVTESVLNSLHDLLTTIFTRGSAAGSSFNDASVRQALATEIRSLRDEIFSLANTEVRGRYLFAGSRVTSAAFEINGDTVSYLGDERVNTIQIAAGLQVEQNIPGSAVFSTVFANIEQLLTAIESGDQAGIESALDQFSDTFSALGQVRTRLGVDLSKLQDSEVALQTQEADINTRRAHVEDANLAEAITRLNQTQTALQATLSAGSFVRQLNLFDYLG
jgi:flagellar hook-associated protein 3 FlgL